MILNDLRDILEKNYDMTVRWREQNNRIIEEHQEQRVLFCQIDRINVDITSEVRSVKVNGQLYMFLADFDKLLFLTETEQIAKDGTEEYHMEDNYRRLTVNPNVIVETLESNLFRITNTFSYLAYYQYNKENRKLEHIDFKFINKKE